MLIGQLRNQVDRSDQIRFVQYIIEHLSANGIIDPGLLYAQPFTDIHHGGLDALFDDTRANELLGVISAVNVVVAR